VKLDDPAPLWVLIAAVAIAALFVVATPRVHRREPAPGPGYGPRHSDPAT